AHSLLSDTVRAPRRPALFPYTTLFRSLRAVLEGVLHGARQQGPGDTAFAIADPDGEAHHRPGGRPALRLTAGQGAGILQSRDQRSEEHTSELQSRENLVCRLLLEKKKH